MKLRKKVQKGPADIRRKAESMVARCAGFILVALEKKDDGGFIFGCDLSELRDESDARHSFLAHAANSIDALVTSMNVDLQKIAVENREKKKVEAAKENRTEELSLA